MTSSTSIVLLLWMLSAAPFVHSHAGIAHDPDAVLHGHLVQRQAAPATEGPALVGSGHEGRTVDLFSSIPAKADPDMVGLEDSPELAPPLTVSFEGRPGLTRHERGPPRSDTVPRAPPA